MTNPTGPAGELPGPDPVYGLEIWPDGPTPDEPAPDPARFIAELPGPEDVDGRFLPIVERVADVIAVLDIGLNDENRDRQALAEQALAMLRHLYDDLPDVNYPRF